MKRVMAGLYEGDRVRVERDGAAWLTEIKLRDCGELIGVETGYLEGSDEGRWTVVGSFRTTKQATRACEMLFSGSHVYRPPHRTADGPMPGAMVPFTEIQQELAAACAPKP